MAALKEEVKLYIVQCLACYDTPSQVADSVKEEFGIEIPRPNIQAYDPTKSQGKNLSVGYVDIFNATRQAFLDDIKNIPIASQSFRLRSLQRMHDYALSRKNFVLAKEILEQAAKEVGGSFTNKLQHGGDKENPLALFIERISGGALPVVHDVDGEIVDDE